MSAFTYEEQEGRKYLVYEKREEDSIDTLTLEMMSNNRIDGVAPSNHIQIDDKFYMKYDITGLKSLREVLQGVVNREKILSIMGSITDAAMAAEDYMLDFSSYVLDEENLYIDPATLKVSMIVLPIMRDETSIDVFLKKILMNIQYDQTEDCSYVVALINLFSGSESFSLCAFKEQLGQFKKESMSVKGTQKNNLTEMKAAEAETVKSSDIQFQNGQTQHIQGLQVQSQQQIQSQQLQQLQLDQPQRLQQSQLYQSQPPQTYSSQQLQPPQAARGDRPIVISDEDRKKIVHDLKREHDIDILFSSEDDKLSKKEKKGFFFKKEKSEKPEKEKKAEKKSFWSKLTKKKSAEKDSDIESALGGIAIPGMDMQNQSQINTKGNGKENDFSQGRYREHEVAIPAQRVAIEKRPVNRQDFGETEYIGNGDDEETLIIGAEQNVAGPEFILYRRSTQEKFRICEEIMRIGRSPSITEICISGNRGVGRIHAILHLRNGQVFIEDNNSKNKTYVDGVQLEPGQSPRKLENGSKIRLGDEELEFCVQE